MADPSTPPWDALPRSVLEEIFRHLGVVQLAQMRLMCRTWNAAICHSPVLMSKFVPKLDKRTVSLPADYVEREEMTNLTSGRYRKIKINAANAIRAAYSPLWEKLGQTVRHLILSGEYQGQLDAEYLLELLRMLPNLTRLELKMYLAVADFDDVDLSDLEDDYRFEQLEVLKLGTGDTEWIPVLSVICPKLKVFKYVGTCGLIEILTKGQMQSFTVADMMPLFLAVQGTLQKISIKEININADSLRLLSSATNIQLKRLTLKEFDRMGEQRLMNTEVFVQLCKAFPTLDSFKFECCYVQSMVLQDLHTILGQLRTFCIKLWIPKKCDDLKVFLSKMPQLEYLGVNFTTPATERFDLDLQGVCCPNLKKLRLGYINWMEHELTDFFLKSPNINHLILENFDVSNKADLVQALSQLKSLETLDINENASNCGVEDTISESDLNGVKLNSVRHLKSGSIPLTVCCPNAESVYLRYVPSVTDEDVIGILRGLPRLRQLKIDSYENKGNELTDAALDFIATEGRHLEELHIGLMANKTSQNARDRLTEALRNVVQLRVELETVSEDTCQIA